MTLARLRSHHQGPVRIISSISTLVFVTAEDKIFAVIHLLDSTMAFSHSHSCLDDCPHTHTHSLSNRCFREIRRTPGLGGSRDYLRDLPGTSLSSQPCEASLLLLFWFLSQPGTVAIGDSHTLALRCLWLLFISNFFFFKKGISSCFSRYSAQAE